MNRTLVFWLAVGWLAFLLLPWYVIEDGFWGLAWILDGYPFDSSYAPAALQVTQGNAPWLAPIALFLLLPVAVINRDRADPLVSVVLLMAGIGGFAWVLGQGFTVGISGWRYEWMDASFGVLETRQYGMGYGALLVSAAFLFLTTQGIAARGVLGGDIFVTSAIGMIVCLVVVFIFFPVLDLIGFSLKVVLQISFFNQPLCFFALLIINATVWQDNVGFDPLGLN